MTRMPPEMIQPRLATSSCASCTGLTSICRAEYPSAAPSYASLAATFLGELGDYCVTTWLRVQRSREHPVPLTKRGVDWIGFRGAANPKIRPIPQERIVRITG